MQIIKKISFLKTEKLFLNNKDNCILAKAVVLFEHSYCLVKPV